MIKPVLALALGLALSSGCTCNRDPDDPPEGEAEGQHFLLCGRLADDGGEEDLEVGSLSFRRNGYELSLTSERDGQTKIGVVSGIEEWNQANEANLDSILQWFSTQGAEAVIVAGGIGANRETCLNVLSHLAASELPIFPLIGASADFAGYRRAVAQAIRDHRNVLDLTVSRLVHWDGVDIVSLPGYHNPFYLRHRRGGCAYEQSDINDLGRLIDAAEQPVLLVAADPPRGRGRDAIDFARGGANIGSPMLAELLSTKVEQAPFGIFGHVYEAGGRASTEPTGGRAVAHNRWSKRLYLNPGAAEAIPYDTQGGGRSRGMGALLEIGSEGARFSVHRVPTPGPNQPQKSN